MAIRPKSSPWTIGLTLVLVGVTAIWGWTFLIVKEAVASYPVFGFLAFRFAVSVLCLAPFVLRGMSRRTLLIGAGIGLSLTAGYLCQTAGLTSTSAANAGLLTGLFVIMTPLLDRLFFSARIHVVTIVAIVGGFGGTALLTLSIHHFLTIGDFLEILTAVAFAVQIIWLGHYARGQSSTQLAFGQLAPAAVLFALLAGAVDGPHFRWPSPFVWFAILVTGVLATSLAFWIQTLVQQHLPPSRVALILLGEPSFAALFAVWIGGERLSAVQWAGASLILISLLCHELWMGIKQSADGRIAEVSVNPLL